MGEITMTTEKELLLQIAFAEEEKSQAKKKITAIKREVLATESHMIAASLKLETLNESLRTHREDLKAYVPTLSDLEVKKFREDHPDVMEFIHQREATRLK
jgi:hypothetical protein